MPPNRDSKSSAAEQRAPGPELRLLDRRAFVGFPSMTLGEGVTIADFALQIPDVTFPFNVSGGASRYQRKKLAFGYLELTVDAERVRRELADAAARIAELDGLKLHFRPGYLEGQARLRGPDRAPLTFKIAFDGDGERLTLYVFDVRFYAFSPIASVQIPVLLARAAESAGVLPEVEVKGATGFTTRVLPALCRAAAVSRGFKMPELDAARLASVEVSSQGLKLRFAAGGLPPPVAADEELLLALEGARAFADAEALIAHGKLAEAREAYLKAAAPQEAHPFAAERLLSLLVADPSAHELALDVAASLARRRERSAAPMWGEAVVRERRGEHARASERYLALCALARRNQEEAAAFFAAEAGARAARDQAPQMAVKALHEVLGLKPDHLPSLRALAKASDQANDRAGAIRAYRRMSALARDPAEAAEAHVQLARLCALTEDDIAGARLHCEAALRLAPDHPDALYQLGELCHRSGEHLRGIKSLDRLREVALARHELERVGRANLLAGRIWEEGLGQLDNALLRYREAVGLLPGAPDALFLLARAAEKQGHTSEAVAAYTQAVELAGPLPASEQIRLSAHGAHHALARLHQGPLNDARKVREHLEAALALDERDAVAIAALLPVYRSQGLTAELGELLEKAGAIEPERQRRAALWAEAAELFRTRLSQPERAETLFEQALDADDRNRLALEGMLAVAEAKRDGALLCRCLKTLAELAGDAKERVLWLRRLSVAARDVAFDLELLGFALQSLLKLEPEDLTTLGELCALERRRADMAGLAQALSLRAEAAEAQGEVRVAAASLRELAQVLEARLGRVGEALVALEKAARLSPDPSTLLELSELSLRCDRPEHARRALEEVLATLPQHTAPERLAEIHARLGQACERVEDADAARRHYERALPLRKLDDELAQRLEALYQAAGLTRELGELWSTRAQALLGADRSEAAAALLVKSARALIGLGEKEAARLKLSTALEHAPEGAIALEGLGLLAELELATGARLEAAKLLARKAQLTPDARSAASLLFQAATLAQGSSREGVLLASAIEKDETFAPARLRRAELTLEQDPSGALADLEAVLARPLSDPDAPKDEARASLLRRAAQAAVRTGQPDVAIRHLEQLLAQEPEDLSSLRELAGLFRQTDRTDALVSLLAANRARFEGAEALQLARELATLAPKVDEPGHARAALRALLQADPTDLWAAERLLPLLGDPLPDGGEEELLGLLTVLADASEGRARADHLTRRARLHRAAGRLEQARQDLSAAASHHDAPAALWREVVELAEREGDARAQIDAWAQVVRVDPARASDAAAPLLALAQARLAQDDALYASTAFRALAQLPQEPADRCEALFGLSAALQKLGDPDGASEALLGASRQGPPRRRVEALLARAELAESRGDLARAVESLEGALGLSPRSAEALSGLKRLFTAQENFEGLAEVLAAEAKGAPKEVAGPLFLELGRLYADRLDRPGAAEAAFRRAAQLSPQDAESRQRLFALLVERAPDEAAAFVEQAAAGQPDADGSALLCEAATRLGALGEEAWALRLLRKAHARAPLEGEPLRTLARTLYLSGAVREALPLLEAAAREPALADVPDVAEALLLDLADAREACGDAPGAVEALRALVEARPLSWAGHLRLAERLAPTDPRAALSLLEAFASGLHDSQAASRLWQTLAETARRELGDVNAAAALLRKAGQSSAAPLAVHEQLAALFREAERVPELMAELLAIADLRIDAGDVTGAIAAYQEEAVLAEGSAQYDEALKSLQAISELCEDEEDLATAAQFQLRRAELLRDVRGDLAGAEAALERAFTLAPSRETAQLGGMLGTQLGPEAQARWIDREVSLAEGQAKLSALLARAELFSLVIGDPARAEADVRAVLELDPTSSRAESLLASLLDAQGRILELAAYYEDRAAGEEEPSRRIALFRKAAHLYAQRANRPDAAAAALIAARAVTPDDLDLTAEAAELLHASGRRADAADFDALLLEQAPLRAGVFERHLAFLEETQDWQGLAALMLRRAERQEGVEAGQSYLAAARAFRKSGANERVLLCEDRAFDVAPQLEEAYAAVRARAEGDARRVASLLAARAHAMPEEAPRFLRERAELLAQAGESLLAAHAYDDLLVVDPDQVEALIARAELAAEAGGPLAAQPYDRRLFAVAGDALPEKVQLRARLRLGHAALGAGALQDAADAFEAVVALEPAGEHGDEALSLLAEVHARTQNAPGLFKTTLRRAQGARPDEAEALYRRAADLFEDPAEAIDALLPLAELRPGDLDVVSRAAAGLKALGRPSELAALYERSAEALGGTRAADLLLAAATLAGEALQDPSRAQALVFRAGGHDPEHPRALRAIAGLQREKGDDAALAQTLNRLLPHAAPEELAGLRLELAEVAARVGEPSLARQSLQALVDQGPAGQGYATALERLEPLLSETEDGLALARVRELRAELVSGEARYALLFGAAQAALGAGERAEATRLLRDAVAARPSLEALELLARVYAEDGQKERAARAWAQAAAVAPAEARAPLLLSAAEAWEAAGNAQEAVDLIDRLRAEHPDHLSEDEAAAWFTRLGDPSRAFHTGFERALAAGDYAQATALAQAAGQADAAQRVLWVAAERDGGEALARLEALLREENDALALSRLAELAHRRGEAEVAQRLCAALVRGESGAPLELRLEALERLLAFGVGAAAFDPALERIAEEPPAFVDRVLALLEGVAPAARLGVLGQLFESLPDRQRALAEHRLSLAQALEAWPEAVEALADLEEVSEGAERAGHLIARGRLTLERLGEVEKAREAFLAALALDADLEAAREGLVQASEQGGGAASLAEDLEALLPRVSAITAVPVREALARCYEALGQTEKLYLLLGEGEPTPEVLERRAKLAGQLGRVVEALELRERLTDEPVALEDILGEYFVANFLPGALRLAERLHREGTLSAHGQRLAAERLAGTPEGAALSVALWPELLRASPLDADGWTLFAEALARLGRADAAAQVDGIGAALVGTASPSQAAPARPLSFEPVSERGIPPPGLVEVGPETMPRLFEVVEQALAGMGLRLRTWLDPHGGVEAYLLGPDELVIGAGALGAFGPVEVRYLIALGLALGPGGAALRVPGRIERLPEAAVAAFDAMPSTLAAAKVIAQVDSSVRGAAPEGIELSAVLRQSEAFRRVALRALEVWGRAE